MDLFSKVTLMFNVAVKNNRMKTLSYAYQSSCLPTQSNNLNNAIQQPKQVTNGVSVRWRWTLYRPTISTYGQDVSKYNKLIGFAIGATFHHDYCHKFISRRAIQL